MPCRRAWRTCGHLLEQGRAKAALDERDALGIVRDRAEIVLAQKPIQTDPLAMEIRREAAESPRQLNYEAISHAFGTPKPTLTNSYSPELLGLRTFPT